MASKEGEGGSGSEPNPSEHILCVDVGTTALKLLLSHRSGAEVSCSTEDYDTDSYATTDPEIWWDAFLRGAEKCVKCLGPGDVVAAVALTGQMQNLLLFDGKDKPTCPLIPYNDSRAGKQAELIESMGMRLEGKAMSEVVGNWKRGYSILPKILWVKEHWREAWAKTKRVLLGSHSFIAMKLCGKYSCDPTTASTTGLQDRSTPCTWHSFNDKVLADVNERLPKILCADRVLAEVTRGALRPGKLAKVLEGAKVLVGSGDLGGVTVGAGSGEAGKHVYIYIGTSGWVAHSVVQKAERSQSANRPGVFMLSHPCDGKLRIRAASCITAGGNIEWLRQTFSDSDGGKLSYEAIERLAAASRPGSNGLLYLPWLNGERSPFTDPNARACFIGLGARTSKSDMCRAVIEGVCYSYKSLVDALGITREMISDGVTVVGGAVKSPIFMQTLSDILEVPVHPMTNSENVGTRGAAIISGVGLKWYRRLRPACHFHESRDESSNDTKKASEYKSPRIFKPCVSSKTLLTEMASTVPASSQTGSLQSSVHAKAYSVFSKLHNCLQEAFTDLSRIES